MRIHVFYPTTPDSEAKCRKWECAACGFIRLATEREVRRTNILVAACASGRRITLFGIALGRLRGWVDCMGRRSKP